MEELPDDVLLELGRLTWAAIRLEDAVREVAWRLAPVEAGREAEQISQRINAARSAGPPESVRGWLEAAGAALERRNTVLHGIPFQYGFPGRLMFPGTQLFPGAHGQGLHHIPRKAGQARTETEVTVEGLRPTREQLDQALGGSGAALRDLSSKASPGGQVPTVD